MDKNGPNIKISLDLLENLHTSQFQGAKRDSDIGIYLNLNLSNLVAKLKFHQIYLKMCILVSLKVLNTNLTLASSDFFNLKSK